MFGIHIISQSGCFEDPEFGTVKVCVRRGMRSVNLRWINDSLEFHVPVGTPLSELERIMRQSREKIRTLREKSRRRIVAYHDGQTISCYRHTITIGRHDYKRRVICTGNVDNSPNALFVHIPADADITSPTITKGISTCLKALMGARAGQYLIPLAKSVAEEKGMRPAGYAIGRGLRKLGHCDRNSVIQLSANLMFYPERLIRYVVCHELAHLVEFNHSPRFHAVCNRLCDGKEADLEAELKAFVPPIVR